MPTYTELMRGFDFGPWSVLPERGLVRAGEDERRLEPRVMDVFVALVSHGGEVVSRDQLIEEVWDGRPQTDDVINRCIRELRKALGDNARAPIYIETLQKRGYRAILPAVLPEPASVADESAAPGRGTRYPWIVGGVAAVLIVAWQVLRNGPDEATDGAAPQSVAVFEFNCIQAAGATDDHLCFGFAEEIISSLQRVENLRIVRKRQAYESGVPIDEDGLVSGSVQILGDQVRIAAQLEDARSGEILWSDSFPSDRRGIFEMQQSVADGAAGYFDADLAASTAQSQSQDQFEARNAYQLGRYLFQTREHESIQEAIRQFEIATTKDPAYGPAWLGLAYMYVILPDYDISQASRRWEIYDEALRIIDEGVERNPAIRDAAGTVYGFIYHKRNMWSEAMEETRRAVESDTASADDFNWHSRVLASVGRLDESLEYARRALDVDPEYYPVTVSRMAIASFWVDDLENAKRYFDLANRADFEASVHFLAYSLYLLRTGAPVESIKAYASAGLERNNLDSSWIGPVVDGIVDEASRPRAIAILEQLSATGMAPANVELTLWVLLGEIDRAMAIAHRTENPRDAGGLFEQELIFIRQFKPFRDHPEFMDFIDRVGLTDYWEEAGCRWAEDRLSCSRQ